MTESHVFPLYKGIYGIRIHGPFLRQYNRQT